MVDLLPRCASVNRASRTVPIFFGSQSAHPISDNASSAFDVEALVEGQPRRHQTRSNSTPMLSTKFSTMTPSILFLSITRVLLYLTDSALIDHFKRRHHLLLMMTAIKARSTKVLIQSL